MPMTDFSLFPIFTELRPCWQWQWQSCWSSHWARRKLHHGTRRHGNGCPSARPATTGSGSVRMCIQTVENHVNETLTSSMTQLSSARIPGCTGATTVITIWLRVNVSVFFFYKRCFLHTPLENLESNVAKAKMTNS